MNQILNFLISAQNSLTGFRDIPGIYFTFKKIPQTNLEFIKIFIQNRNYFFLIQGEDEDILINYLIENKPLIINTIKEGERKEKIRRIKKSPSKSNILRKKMRINLVYPSVYKKVKDTFNFIWLEKQILKGTLNIISYRLPLNTISDPPKLNDVIRIRDSIGKINIPGRLEGTHMITEKNYRPYFYKLNMGGKIIFETKGMWEVKNDFMGGPFINYILKDKKSNEWVIVEGFAFAPSVSKRDYMFELNSILSTISINN